MKCHRVRRTIWIGTGFLLVPPFLWVAVVLLAPTDWVKHQVVAALEARSCRPVRLQGVSACLLGGISLANLEIGSPMGVDDPWLKCGELRLDLSLFQILRGRLEPMHLEFDRVKLRILRQVDGSLELADLTHRSSASDKVPDKDGKSPRARDPLVVQIHNATIEILDESTKTRILLENVEGDGSCEDKLNSIHNLCGTVNGGPFRFAGHLDRNPPVPRFQGRFVADNVALDDGMTGLLRYVVPVLAGSSLHLKGKMHTDLLLSGSATTLAELRQSLQGQGEIAINPIDLDGACVMDELTKIAEFSGRGHLASVRSDFVIRDQRVKTDHFSLNVGRVPITMSGWSDLDGRIDYQIKLDELAQRIPDKARRILSELDIDVRGLNMLTLNGTTDQITVKVNGMDLDRNHRKDNGLHRDDREKLKALGRQFLDKLVR